MFLGKLLQAKGIYRIGEHVLLEFPALQAGFENNFRACKKYVVFVRLIILFI
jgi:hypothetical protein